MTDKSAALFRASNVQILDYPLEASLLSALQVFDEAVIVVGQSEDDTLDYVYWLRDSVGAHRVIVVETIFTFDRMWQERWWNMASAATDAEWLVFQDADEVFHENDAQALCDLMADPAVSLIRQPFLHFFATKDYQINFSLTHNTRIGRRSIGYRMVNLCTDETPTHSACAMHFGKNGQSINAHAYEGPELINVDAPIYHYGWCRKAQAIAISQAKHSAWYANGNGLTDGRIPDVKPYPYEMKLSAFLESGQVQPYTSVHPAVMREWFDDHRHDWDRIENRIKQSV